MTIGISLNVPAADGVGTTAQAGNMQMRKTFIVEGAFDGGVIFEAQGVAAGPFCQVGAAYGPSRVEIDIVCVALRVRRTGTGSGTPTVDVSAEEGVVRAAALTVPAAAGVGASTNVSTYGDDVSLFVGSPFGGVIAVEGSADDTDWGQLSKTFTGPGCEVLKAPSNYARVRRSGSVSGTPLVSYAAVSQLQQLGLDGIRGLRIHAKSDTEADVFAGSCRDSTNGTVITTAATLTADITASGVNGLDTGAEAADTWYYVHIIDGPGFVVAALLSLSATAPTLPTGYTVFRRVGVVRNDSASAFMRGKNYGNSRSREWFYNEPRSALVILANGSSETWVEAGTAGTLAGLMPPTAERVQLLVEQATAAVDSQFRANGFAQVTDGTVEIVGPNSGDDVSRLAFSINTDDQIVQYIDTAAGGSLDVWLASYIDEL